VDRVYTEPVDQASFLHRMSISWLARFSVRTRHEIACAIAIIGLLTSLLASVAVYVVFTSTPFSASFFQGCLALGLEPVAVALGSLILGILVLLCGVYLLPEKPKTTFIN